MSPPDRHNLFSYSDTHTHTPYGGVHSVMLNRQDKVHGPGSILTYTRRV